MQTTQATTQVTAQDTKRVNETKKLGRIATALMREIEDLLESDEPNKRGSTGKTALMYAVSFDCANANDLVNHLLQNGADPNLVDDNGRNCLFYANDRTMSAVLAKPGVYLDQADNEGLTALSILAQRNQRSAICALICAGAKLNTRDKRGRTALITCHEVEIIVV